MSTRGNSLSQDQIGQSVDLDAPQFQQSLFARVESGCKNQDEFISSQGVIRHPGHLRSIYFLWHESLSFFLSNFVCSALIARLRNIKAHMRLNIYSNKNSADLGYFFTEECRSCTSTN